MDFFTWTRRRNEKIANAVQRAGETLQTLQEIADEYGLTRERVRQIALARGVVTTRPGPRRLAGPVLVQAIDLYKRDMPVAHIADILGFTDKSMVYALERAGVHVPQSKDEYEAPWTEEETEFLKVHYCTSDWPASRIADRLDRTRNGIIGRAHRIGLGGRDNRGELARKVRALLATGMHPHDVARETGAGRSYVYQIKAGSYERRLKGYADQAHARVPGGDRDVSVDARGREPVAA